MQKVSRMQRNRFDYRTTLETWLIFIGLVIYGSIATLYPFLPPLFGFMVVLLIRSEHRFFIPALLYLLFFEAEHNHIIFSSWLFVFLYVRFLLPVILNIIVCRSCVAVITVIFSYLLFYALNYVLYFMVGDSFINIDWALLAIFIIIESVLAVVLL